MWKHDVSTPLPVQRHVEDAALSKLKRTENIRINWNQEDNDARRLESSKLSTATTKHTSSNQGWRHLSLLGVFQYTIFICMFKCRSVSMFVCFFLLKLSGCCPRIPTMAVGQRLERLTLWNQEVYCTKCSCYFTDGMQSVYTCMKWFKDLVLCHYFAHFGILEDYFQDLDEALYLQKLASLSRKLQYSRCFVLVYLLIQRVSL